MCFLGREYRFEVRATYISILSATMDYLSERDLVRDHDIFIRERFAISRLMDLLFERDEHAVTYLSVLMIIIDPIAVGVIDDLLSETDSKLFSSPLFGIVFKPERK